MPKVSVVIPTYNSSDLVVQAIDSVLAQTYKDYEIIVVDDGSTDDTRQLLQKRYGDLIRYIYQENGHISKARNHGCRVAKGEYIANLDADDLWLPQKLEKQIKLFDEHPDTGLVYCDGYVRNIDIPKEEDILISKNYPPIREGKIFDYVFKASPVPSSAAVFPRVVWESLGGLNENMRGGQDYEFFARISAQYLLYAVNEPLMVYRFHSKNTSSKITHKNVKSRIARKLNVRRIVLDNVNPVYWTKSIKLFSKMPLIIQYTMLLYWRLCYGASKTRVIRNVYEHFIKLLGWSK